MAVNTSPIFPLTPTNIVKTVVNADSTNKVAILAAGANGTRIDSLSISTDDTATHDVQLWLTISAVDYLVGTIALAAGAGNTSGVAAKAVLSDANIRGFVVLDPFGNYVFYLKASQVLKVSCPVAMTAAKTLYVTGLAGDY